MQVIGEAISNIDYWYKIPSKQPLPYYADCKMNFKKLQKVNVFFLFFFFFQSGYVKTGH